jgi:hypothetical protein
VEDKNDMATEINFRLCFSFKHSRKKKKSMKQSKGRHIKQKDKFRGRMKWGRGTGIKVESKVK